jgi:LacI family transcriptional regulator
MPRPTISDLAQAAGVSVSTIDRVLNGRNPVRRDTAERVLAAAEQIGFYATSAIKQRLGTDRPDCKLGFLLQQGSRIFYRDLGNALIEASKACTTARVDPKVEFMDDLSADTVASEIRRLGSRMDALGVVAAQHPKIAQAIDKLGEDGVPVFALISELSSQCGVGYVGLDNWKVGRTAAWMFTHICKKPGKIGILVGSHRYRCQELNEIGCRSYFREHAPEFQLLEPLSTFEDKRIAEELTRDLLEREPELAGLYFAGGGITGGTKAIREMGLAGQLVTVGHELMDITRAALLDAALSIVISHPLQRMGSEVVSVMVAAATAGASKPLPATQLPFDIFTSENLL